MFIVDTGTKKISGGKTLDLGGLPASVKIDFQLTDGSEPVNTEGKNFALTVGTVGSTLYMADDDIVSFRKVEFDGSNVASYVTVKMTMDGVEVLSDTMTLTYQGGGGGGGSDFDNISVSGSAVFTGDGFSQTTIQGGTITAQKVQDGNGNELPFQTPVESTTSSSLLLSGNKAYAWDLTGSTSTNLLDTEGGVALGQTERLWSVDISIGSSASVQYGLSFDSAGSDALTASKVNRCVVRYDGTTSRLYCYATEDIA